jgi:hypothetical protein
MGAVVLATLTVGSAWVGKLQRCDTVGLLLWGRCWMFLIDVTGGREVPVECLVGRCGDDTGGMQERSQCWWLAWREKNLGGTICKVPV